MFTLTFAEVLVALVAFAFGVFILKDRKKDKYSTLPPGPWGLPIVGHLPFLGSHPGITFMKWAKEFGPVFSVRFGSVPTVILNDAKSIRAAFNKEEFAGRPLLPVMAESSNRKGFLFTDGPHAVEQRRYTIKTLKEFGVGSSSVETRTREENAAFVKYVSNVMMQNEGKPIKMNKLFRYAVINSFWDSVMGSRFEEDDPKLATLITMTSAGTDTHDSKISQIMWYFPWISKVGDFIGYNPPLHGFQHVYKYVEKEVEKAKLRFVKGQSNYFTEAYFNKVDETTDPNSSFHVSQKNQAITTGDMLMAAIETTVTTLDWIMIYMARHEDVQEKLRAEIDRLTGGDESRVLSLSDQKSMPYTEAVITEILRISSIGPLAVAHRTVTDVDFQGYHYPADTMVISNLYALHHDPEIWDEPSQFRPQRFFNEDKGEFVKPEPELAPFGIGKRICPGERFARDQIFLLATNFLRKFEVSHAETIPSLDPIFGFVTYPRPFELQVTKR